MELSVASTVRSAWLEERSPTKPRARSSARNSTYSGAGRGRSTRRGIMISGPHGPTSEQISPGWIQTQSLNRGCPNQVLGHRREVVELRRVLHQDAATGGLTWNPLRQKIEEYGIVRFRFFGRVRPVARPDHAFRRYPGQLARDPGCVRVIGPALLGVEVRPGELHPGVALVEKASKRRKAWISRSCW